MARYDDRRDNIFLILWTLAVAASALALLFYLGVRVRSVELGYELGRVQAELSRAREIERVLLLERSASETPERIDLIGRTLFGMREASADRILDAGLLPEEDQDEEATQARIEGRLGSQAGH